VRREAEGGARDRYRPKPPSASDALVKRPRKPYKPKPPSAPDNCIFTEPSVARGRSGRGKRNHFNLLDRYIRRIDALVPEAMEDLVRPLSYKPNQEQTTRTLKITFGGDDEDEDGVPMNVGPVVAPASITEEDLKAFLQPLEPHGMILGWESVDGEPEVYVKFMTNEECRLGRERDGRELAGVPARVRFSVDDKYEKIAQR